MTPGPVPSQMVWTLRWGIPFCRIGSRFAMPQFLVHTRAEKHLRAIRWPLAHKLTGAAHLSVSAGLPGRAQDGVHASEQQLSCKGRAFAGRPVTDARGCFDAANFGKRKLQTPKARLLWAAAEFP